MLIGTTFFKNFLFLRKRKNKAEQGDFAVLQPTPALKYSMPDSVVSQNGICLLFITTLGTI